MPDTEPESSDGRVLRARALRRERRSQILAAARSVFADKGYVQTSIRDLLDAAGIARGTFYAHYDGKSAAFAAVLSDLLDRLAGAVKRVDIHSGDAIYDQLQANVVRVLRVVEDEAALTAMLFHHAQGVDPDFDEQLSAFYERLASLIRRSLTTGQGLGIVREGDVGLLASLILGAIKQVATEPLDTGRQGRTLEQLADELLSFVMHGVLVRQPPS